MVLGKILTSIFAHERNSKYRDSDGDRLIEFVERGHYTDIRALRKLFNHEALNKINGFNRTYYNNGKIESEEIYQNSQLNGLRKIYYPNGQLFLLENYSNDTLEGKRTWYYKSGQISWIEFRLKGIPINKAIGYADSTNNSQTLKFLIENNYATSKELIYSFKSIRVENEEYYGDNGKKILSRRLYWNGMVCNESILLGNGFQQCFDYYRNGNLKRTYLLNTNNEKENIKEFAESENEIVH
ncbi:MAG: hypothetical protein IPF62_12115 [Bacteroidetes bacterium]|nr:hypothetical protein [Bacteroidota bacterium]